MIDHAKWLESVEAESLVIQPLRFLTIDPEPIMLLLPAIKR
jgi:hypothetical protein